MAVQTTSNLSSALRTRYLANYVKAADMMRLYDQLAEPFTADLDRPLAAGSSVTLNFLSDLEPVTSAISEVVDVTPATQRDGTTTVSPTSRANAIQVAEKLLIRSYTNYGQERFEHIGKNMMESVEVIARQTATKGTNLTRAAARASLDAGTSGHRASSSTFTEAMADLMTLKVPGFDGLASGAQWMAIMHPYVYNDIRQADNVLSIAQYQDKGILLSNELASISPFSLVVSPWAKVFWSAGADNASNVATTIDADENALDKTISVASATNISAGGWLTIGTEETGDTHYPTNERVRVASVSGTDITIIGEGANGGLRFDHASGTAVRNGDSAFTIVFGGPASLAGVFHVENELGRYGTVVGPLRQGLVEQWESLGWKWYGAYGRPIESRLLRAEVSVSAEA